MQGPALSLVCKLLHPSAIQEVRLLKRISQAYHLPDWCSIDDYCHIATEKLGMTGQGLAVTMTKGCRREVLQA